MIRQNEVEVYASIESRTTSHASQTNILLLSTRRPTQCTLRKQRPVHRADINPHHFLWACEVFLQDVRRRQSGGRVVAGLVPRGVLYHPTGRCGAGGHLVEESMLVRWGVPKAVEGGLTRGVCVVYQLSCLGKRDGPLFLDLCGHGRTHLRKCIDKVGPSTSLREELT